MNRRVLLAAVMFGSIVWSVATNAEICNKKAAAHQSKARDIYFKVTEIGQIPSKQNEDFVICMMDQREDKDAFRHRVAKLRANSENDSSTRPAPNGPKPWWDKRDESPREGSAVPPRNTAVQADSHGNGPHRSTVALTAPIPGFAGDAEQNQPAITIRRHQVKEIKAICQGALKSNIPARQFTVCTEIGGIP